MGKSFPAASLRPASNHRRGHARRRAFVRRAAVLLLDGQRQRKRAASYAMRKARAAILAYNQRRRQVRGVIGCPGVGDPCEVSCRWPIFLPVSPTRPRRPLKSGDCRAVGKWLPRSACRTRAVAPMHRQPRLRRVRSSILARTRRSRRPWSAWSARRTACVWRWCAMPASYAAAPRGLTASHAALTRRILPPPLLWAVAALWAAAACCVPTRPVLLRAGWGSGGGGRRVVCAEGRGRDGGGRRPSRAYDACA